MSTKSHEMRVMDATGDTKIVWNPQNNDEVEAARASFNSLRAKGYLAYKVQPGGEKGTVITTFEPNAEKLILAPAVTGG